MLLNALAEMPAGLSFTELLVKLDIPKSSLHALLSTLAESRMVVYYDVTKTYGLGPKIWEFSMAYYDRISVVPLAWPYLQKLRGLFDETIQLAVRDGTDVVYVSKIESTRPIQLASHVGSRLPAYATGLGKAMLACLPVTVIDQLYPLSALQRFTKNTIATVTQLKRVLTEIRQVGYSEDHGEYSPHVHCIAVPIVGWKQQLIGALSISGPEGRFPLDRDGMIAALRDTAQRLSAQMGAVDPEGWRQVSDEKSADAEIRPQLL